MIKHIPNRKTAKQTATLQTPTFTEDSDDEGGFSKWLKTNEGAKLMWYFIIGNSTVVFITTAWPKIQEAFAIICSMFSEY